MKWDIADSRSALRVFLLASLLLVLLAPYATGLPAPTCSLALGASCDVETLAPPNCCSAMSSCIDDATTLPAPHFSCSSCIPAGSTTNCNAEDILCCSGLDCGTSGSCEACQQADQACSGTGQGTCCQGLACDPSAHLCCGGSVGGKSPDECRQCITGAIPLCTCDPASAQAGTSSAATKAEADACGYSMPTASTPPLPSDVKNCIGSATVPPAAQPVTIIRNQEFLSCYLSDCNVLGTHIGYNYGESVTAPIIGQDGSVIGTYGISGMRYTSRDGGDCDTRYEGDIILAFDPAKVASASSASISGIAADDASDFGPGYTSNNWACGDDCAPSTAAPFVPFTRINDLQYTHYWSIRDRCAPSASLRAIFTITYTPATSNAYQTAPLTYTMAKSCTPPIQPNRPPAAPPKPWIAPSSITNEGTFSCASNCQLASPPIDPDGDAVTVTYQWRRNGALSSQPGLSFDCTINGCAAGDRVTISAKACDSFGACSSEITSNEGMVGNALPPSKGSMDLTYIALALACAIAVLALAYMASYLFSLPQVRAIVQDELLQVIATGVVALSLLGVQAAMDGYGVKMLAGSGVAVTCSDWNNAATCSTSMMKAAQGTLDTLSGKAASLMDSLAGADGASRQLGKEASKGVFCNFLGVGFTLVNCSQLNAFRGALTLASFAAMGALADVYAQQFLLSLIAYSGFSLILPLGMFMRCFKVSRRAGGALIAIGFGFYTVYPAVIVATENLLHGSNPSSPSQVPKVGACDPRETNEGETMGAFVKYATELTDFGRMHNLTYFVLVRVIFMSVLNLIITLGFIRAFAHTIGSDIDVAALARIA